MKMHCVTTVVCLSLAAGSLVRSTVGADTGDACVDVTAHVEILGCPYQAEYPDGPRIYARNIWDLCVTDGEVLIGAGNSSNEGPSPNAGPVPVIAYAPSNGQFRTVFTVDDEQIDIFRVLDGTVYIPGHDPRETWELGNFYRRESGGLWRKYRNIPSGIHNYDMTSCGGILFAGLGTKEGAAVAMSRDSGSTWTNVPLRNFRIHAFLMVKQEVYATARICNEDSQESLRHKGREAPAGVYQFDGRTGLEPRKDLGSKQLFPGIVAKPSVDARIARSLSFKDRAVYVGAYCHNDHQFMPFGAFVADSLKAGSVSIRRVPLPKDARVWDLLCDGDTFYVLQDFPDAGSTTVRVTASTDGVQWVEVLHFRSKAFARSFAILQGDFYFGLGCEVSDPGKWSMEELLPETGQILRVKRRFWEHRKQGNGM